jgi:hypothetical protein
MPQCASTKHNNKRKERPIHPSLGRHMGMRSEERLWGKLPVLGFGGDPKGFELMHFKQRVFTDCSRLSWRGRSAEEEVTN